MKTIIEWKPYPKNEPSKEREGCDFLLTVKRQVVVGTWFSNNIDEWGFDYGNVSAFAELPKPYTKK